MAVIKEAELLETDRSLKKGRPLEVCPCHIQHISIQPLRPLPFSGVPQSQPLNMAHVGALPKVQRYVTGHNDKGQAIFSNAFDEDSKMKANDDGIAFALSYTTKGFPVDMTDDQDLKVYEKYLNRPPGLVISGGTVLRHVDIPPNTKCTMHRTVSLDYGCVLEGEVQLLLDSGEERVMRRGDVAIQRGTMHQWINQSETEWTRM